MSALELDCAALTCAASAADFAVWASVLYVYASDTSWAAADAEVAESPA